MGCKPLVSIGIPVHNGEPSIRRALDSLLAQDYPNFEIIISENASSDGTRQICKDYEIKDECVKVFVIKHKIGMMENFAAVLQKARGSYFMWAASDDSWLPQFVSIMVDELEAHPEASLAMSAIELDHQEGTLHDTLRFDGEDNPNELSYYQVAAKLLSPTKYNLFLYGLFRTTVLRQAMARYPFGVFGHDRWFMCQIALATRFRYVDRILYVRTIHTKSYRFRYPEERFSRMEIEDKWANLKSLCAFAQMLSQSPVIPRYRKMYIPILLFRFIRWRLLPRLWAPCGLFIRSHCPPTVRRQLRRVKTIFAPSLRGQA